MDAEGRATPGAVAEEIQKPKFDVRRATTIITDYEILADQQWLTIGDAEFDLATAMQHGCTELWTNDARLHHAAMGMAVNSNNRNKFVP